MHKLITLPYLKKSLPAYYSFPQTGNQVPGIILIHEIWGLDDHIKDVADRLSGHGYAVLAPDLFEDTPIKDYLSPGLAREAFDPKTRDQAQVKLRALFAPLSSPEFGRSVLSKLESCFGFLSSEPLCTKKIAVMGFCFGGTYSFAFAEREPKIAAAVPFYGSPPDPLDKVQNISCPVLAFYGQKDERLIGNLPKLKAEMKKYHRVFEAIVYPGAGHAFFNNTNPNTYSPKAAKDAWSKTLAFLQKHLQ